MAAKKKADSPSSDAASNDVQTTTSARTVYLAPGEVPDLTPREPYLDPKLAEIREAEIKKNDVKIAAPQEPTIDDALVKARDEQIKRETDRAKNSK